ncbi:MAG: addiction module protein [Nitrospirae bacterium]|nr:addiction module protein [Nitrospirota bacterium]
MTKSAEKLASEIHFLPDVEKLRLLDAILTDLDKPDAEIDRVWAEEARKQWAAYKAGRIPAISYFVCFVEHYTQSTVLKKSALAFSAIEHHFTDNC